MKNRKHLLITGPARSGTTFLIALYGRIGFRVGFEKHIVSSVMSPRSRTHGGLEILRSIYGAESVRKKLKEVDVIKHPWVFAAKKTPMQMIDLYELSFDNIILTKRDPEIVVKSQVDAKIRKGRFSKNKREEWEERHRSAIYKKYQQLTDWVYSSGSNVIEVEFPSSVEDFDYLWKKIEPTLKGKAKGDIKMEWDRLSDPKYVHFR